MHPRTPSLLSDLNYLNTSEIKAFCRRHAIPYAIVIETPDGQRRRTGDEDRKGVILDRIRHFLRTGVVQPPTCFPAPVVRFDPLPAKLRPADRLYYGQYDKASPAMTAFLEDLTGGRFRNGAIARILAREFWGRGRAPTFREFATAWLKASEEHTKPNPEWAFLSDRAAKRALPDWKQLRSRKAARVMKILAAIPISEKA